jgi:hypothetical protein
MGADDEPLDRRRYLAIYLQDHRAGAEAGVRLARRCRDHAPNAEIAGELARVADDIDEDRRDLATIMAGLDIDPSTVKQVAGLAAERVGRLKLNGRLLRQSPLTVVVETEALIGAVAVKRQLWATLRTLAATDRLPEPQLESLLARADDQRDRLRAIHGRLVELLFASPDEPAVPGASSTGAGGPPR